MRRAQPARLLFVILSEAKDLASPAQPKPEAWVRIRSFALAAAPLRSAQRNVGAIARTARRSSVRRSAGPPPIPIIFCAQSGSRSSPACRNRRLNGLIAALGAGALNRMRRTSRARPE